MSGEKVVEAVDLVKAEVDVVKIIQQMAGPLSSSLTPPDQRFALSIAYAQCLGALATIRTHNHLTAANKPEESKLKL